MKKTVSTPCALAGMSFMFCWMGIAEGWSDEVVLALLFAGFLLVGVSWGGIAFDFYDRVIRRKGGGE